MSERKCSSERVWTEWKRRFERYVTGGGRPWGDHRCWDGVCAAQFLLTCKKSGGACQRHAQARVLIHVVQLYY